MQTLQRAAEMPRQIAPEGIIQLGGSGEVLSLAEFKHTLAIQFPTTVKLPHYMTRRIIFF